MSSQNRIRVLMVAEKPSLAKSIASLLSNKNSRTTKRNLEVHEYNGRFLTHSDVQFKVTSVIGHVMSMDFPPQYQNWEKTDPASLFAASTCKKEANPKVTLFTLSLTASGSIQARVLQHLKTEAKGCSYLILWLDCDREGENICFEVMDHTLPFMNKVSNQQVFRAKFSAISEVEIKRAMGRLGAPNHNEALAVDGRQELDLKVGVAFTRFQTRFFQGKYGNLDSALISYGPCQIPTLNFCVERYQLINEFQPEPYWSLSLSSLKTGIKVQWHWNRDRIFDEDVVLLFQSLIKEAKKLQIISVKCTHEHKRRPLGLNTVEMLKVASSALNMGPHYTMQIAEKLYTQGYISYPRTESSRYPPNYDFHSILTPQTHHPIWGAYIQHLIKQGVTPMKSGVDAGDHPPISPVACATNEELSGDSWRLYDYISRHFFASISQDALYECHEVVASCSSEINLRFNAPTSCPGEIFSASGSRLIKEGFITLMPWRSTQNEALPGFVEGEEVKIEDVVLTQGKTTPPGYLTESELISLMEKHGIGTDASIAVHINNICERNYVKVESGRRMVPTELGITLIKGYQNIDSELCQPQVRAYVEKQIDLVAKGKVEKHTIVQSVLNQFLQKFKFFVLHISRMDALFEASFSPLSSTGKTFGKCGKCKRYMKYISSKPSRLYCSSCEEVYRLPQGGVIKQYKSLECPLDGFELVLFSMNGTDGKSIPLCPYCFSNPPFEEALKISPNNSSKAGMPCTTCLHPSCPHSAITHGVSACVGCDEGTLVLDPVSGPKWRLDCNKCPFLIYLPENLYSVKVTKIKCKDCGSAMLDFNWKKGTSPLGENGGEIQTCLICDEHLLSLCNIKRSFGRGSSSRHPHRHRGRGKPRGKPPSNPLMSFRDF
eukprot:g3551.t1